jgi:hypothetical protein
MVWDATPTKTPFEQNQDYLSGVGPEPASSVVQLTQAPTDTATGQGPSTTSTSTQAGTGVQNEAPAPAASGYEQSTGTLRDKLLNPIKTGTTAEKSNVQGLQSAFQQAAGPSRTWESIGGSDIFGKAVNQGTGLDTAKGLLGATYGDRPQALDSEQYAKSMDALNQLYNRSEALGTGEGLIGYIQTVDPSQTMGKARYNAQQLFGDSGFRSEIPTYQTQAKEAADWAKAQGTEAEAFAKQRAQEESDIQKQAQAWTDTARSGLESTWNERVAGTGYDAKRKAVEDALAQLTATGQMPGSEVAPGVEAVKGSDLQKNIGEASTAWDTIMNDPRYAPIRDMELLQLTQTARGRPVREPTGGWEKWIKAHPDVSRKQRRLMLERQDALEKLFNPKTEGKFSGFKPLYFAGDTNLTDTTPSTFEMSSLSPYATPDVGLAPTAENVATDEETARYNRIAQLLDQMGMTQQDAYREPTLNIDTEKYLADEAARQKIWEEKPTKQMKEWWKKAKKAEEKYDKSKGSFNPFDIKKQLDQAKAMLSNQIPSFDFKENMRNPHKHFLKSYGPLGPLAAGAEQAAKKPGRAKKTPTTSEKPA